MATERLLLSTVIDAKENCDIMTLDVPNTFTQGEMLESINGKQTILKISGVLVSILCEMTPEVYKDFLLIFSINC